MPRCVGCGRVTKKIPDYLPIGNWYNHDYLESSEYEHEEPDESRGSRPVLWEGRGEITLPDPIGCKPKERPQTKLTNRMKWKK